MSCSWNSKAHWFCDVRSLQQLDLGLWSANDSQLHPASASGMGRKHPVEERVLFYRGVGRVGEARTCLPCAPGMQNLSGCYSTLTAPSPGRWALDALRRHVETSHSTFRKISLAHLVRSVSVTIEPLSQVLPSVLNLAVQSMSPKLGGKPSLGFSRSYVQW